MIAFLRHLFFDDVWLKLFSLALAILIWVTLAVASQREGNARRDFSKLPVDIVSTSGDPRGFKVVPTEVAVTVQGEAQRIENLLPRDIRVLVDLTGLEAARELRKRLEVAPPPGVTLLRVTPEEVLVTKSSK
jgi:YbbR domain-containing protein